MNNDNFLKVILWPWLEHLFQLELDVPTFVASNPLFGGPAPIDWNGTKATAIIEFFAQGALLLLWEDPSILRLQRYRFGIGWYLISGGLVYFRILCVLTLKFI